MTTTPTPITPQPEQKLAVKTWKPTTAGILTLIPGILNVIIGIFISIGPMMGMWMTGWMWWAGMGIGVLSGAFIVTGIISIISGVFAIQRRRWGTALAGAICALFPVIIFGILSIIFITLSKKEFA